MLAYSKTGLGSAALALIALSQPAGAETLTWKGGEHRFVDDIRWSPKNKPGKDDDLIITIPDSVVVVKSPSDSKEARTIRLGSGNRIVIEDPSSPGKYYPDFLTIYGNIINDGIIEIGSVAGLEAGTKRNLAITGTGTVILKNATSSITGSFAFGSALTVRGAGFIGYGENADVNNGLIQADQAGQAITMTASMSGTGTFRSQNGGELHFGNSACGYYLTNDSRLQLEGADFTVGKDYKGANFGGGNSFDARRNVTGTGRVLAVDARQVVTGSRLADNVIDFGALRVGDRVGTTLFVNNFGRETTLRGAVQNKSAPNVQVTNADFALDPYSLGHVTGLTFVGSTSGSVSGQTIDVVNNFDNVGDDHFAVHAKVYAPAVVYLPGTTIDFGTVRKGTTGVTAGITVGNAASGQLTDELTLGLGETGGKIDVIPLSAVPLAAGEYRTLAFALRTDTAGLVASSTGIAFGSTDRELGGLYLGSKTLTFTGTVTDPAVAALAKLGGAGVFGGGGDVYTLDLGRLRFGTFGTEIAVLNTVFGSGFVETLGGGFTLTGDAGYSFVGDAFSGLAGGGREVGRLGFDTRRLALGTYQGVLTFTGFSRYAGLDDLALAPIRLNLRATVVPEPATWALMIAGFGTVGVGLRRRRATIAA